MPITHISDTARWVAVYRAMESERPDALFSDPYARSLAGPAGEEIVQSMKRGRAMAWAMIVRTSVFDRVILETIRDARVDCVVNLAAGLDARPWRLTLPGSLRWIDVDLPDILEYKRTTIGDAAPRCRYEMIATDLTDAAARRALFERLGRDAQCALIVAEGLLIYLTAEQVGQLAGDLAGMPSARFWLIDLASPRLLKIMTRYWGRSVDQGNAPFRFAPEEGSRFFERFGWREARFYSALREAHSLHREMRWMWLWRMLGRLSSAARRREMERMSGFVLLERTGSSATAGAA